MHFKSKLLILSFWKLKVIDLQYQFKQILKTEIWKTTFLLMFYLKKKYIFVNDEQFLCLNIFYFTKLISIFIDLFIMKPKFVSVRVQRKLQKCWLKIQYDIDSSHVRLLQTDNYNQWVDGIYEVTLNTKIVSGNPWQNWPNSGESGENLYLMYTLLTIHSHFANITILLS